jgi:hypothetical protein
MAQVAEAAKKEAEIAERITGAKLKSFWRHFSRPVRPRSQRERKSGTSSLRFKNNMKRCKVRGRVVAGFW